MYFKYFFGSSYIDPSSENSNNFSDHQYDRFTKSPAIGFMGGVNVSCVLYKHWGLAAGLLFCDRRDIYQGNPDTVIKYNAVPNDFSFNNIHNTINYEYYYNNIELPLFLTFKAKRINFYAGVRFTALTFYKADYTYLQPSNIYPFFSASGPVTHKTVRSIEIPWMIFPAFQLSYEVSVKNIFLHPFIGADFGTGNSIFVQAGVLIPIFINHKNPKKS
jgi:hypothetical protein